MEEDLQLTNVQYNIALSLFFVPYIIFEIPCNIILKMMRPSTWISSITVAWGIVMTLMGLVTNHKGLYVARMFLGLAEAGFFPGATFLLTLWYKRHEVQTRMSFFYAGARLAGAFSGLLAYAIQYMDGIAGLGGWKW
jgi:MFS family permease